MRQRMTDMKDRVMGVASDTPQQLSGAASNVASSAADTARGAPDTARRVTEGNPIAAGLVAFDAGLVIATLFPETRTEERLAETVQPQLEQLAFDAGQVTQDAAKALKPAVQHAADDLAHHAQDSVTTVKDQATHAAHETADQA